MNRQNAEFQDNTLYDTIMMDICHYIVVQAHRIHNIMREPYFILWIWGDYDVLMKRSSIVANVQLRWGFLIMRRLGTSEGKECTRNVCTIPSIFF